MSDGRIPIMPVVMCGGSGILLWPASRDSLPKQFLDLIRQHSNFQAAVKRVSASDVFLRSTIISSIGVRFIVAERLGQIGVETDVVLEPIQRDSAAAIAVAACYAARHHPETVVLTMAADHIIEDVEAFIRACRSATEPAYQGQIMTLSVVPQYSATSYSYIKPGRAIIGMDPIGSLHSLR